jgi:two-component system, cell cycle sensor histidine kinase and response regulator CckA
MPEYRGQLTEDHLRLLVDSVKDYAIFMLNPQGTVVTWNQGAQRIKGYRPEEVLGQPHSIFYLKEDVLLGKPHQALETALSQGRFEVEGWRVRNDGSRFCANEVLTPLKDSGCKLIGFCKVVRDVTERMRMQKALAESESRYRRYFDSNLAASLIFTPKGELLGCNPAFTRMFGFDSTEEAVKQNLATLFVQPAGFAHLVTTVAKQGVVDYCEQELRRKDGSPLFVVESAVGTFDDKGELVQILGYFIDETARRKTELQLRQDQKMNAVGRLAGGIAHDFNNILGIVIGCGEVLSRDLKPESAGHKYLETMLEATRRGAGLVRQLLVFSRQQVVTPTTLDLNVIITDLVRMLTRLIGEDVELVTHLDPDLGSVKADQNQLEQIIVNLAANARDAMPKCGRLSIETKNVLVNEQEAKRQTIPQGEYVLLTVSDNGIGMDEVTRSRIFEPFFSTKEFGNRIGLGLSIVYGIVKQSGGFITVNSELGQGAAFKVYLPFVPRPAMSPTEVQTENLNERGTETVLVAEDEPALLEIIQEHLTSLGYAVLSARNGEEALAVLASSSEPIHLLITDVVMPKMGGRQLVERFRALGNKIPVIYISGYTNNTIAQNGLLGAGVDFLQKPFRVVDLSQKIRRLLKASSDPASRNTAVFPRDRIISDVLRITEITAPAIHP